MTETERFLAMEHHLEHSVFDKENELVAKGEGEAATDDYLGERRVSLEKIMQPATDAILITPRRREYPLSKRFVH
jgi:hypothetical protein